MRFPPILITLLALINFTLLSAQPGEAVRYKTMGLDMELLSYGGSLGGFYSYHTSKALSLDVEIDWSLVEANDTFAYTNYWGQPIQINNRNLSFLKIIPGVSYFPFLETMHPTVQVGGFAAAGPVWSLNTDDDDGFAERWKEVDVKVTPMFRAGVHFRIMSGQGAAYNFRLGYDYARFDEVIDSRQTYQGLFFQAGMEFIHR